MSNRSRCSFCGRYAALFVLASLAAVTSVTSGCKTKQVDTNPSTPIETPALLGRLSGSSVERVDLLLVVDNSRGMADKQEILALAVEDLVTSLANPLCIDPKGAAAPVRPASAAEDCPAGMQREIDPLEDIHIGVISSSLGGHGSDACKATTPTTASNDDRGHLLARTAPDDTGQAVETYQDKGYLAWDPAQTLDPPGESDLTALVPKLRDMVVGVGQIGCGYESQLESWYRFLVDPEPYESITVTTPGGSATPNGIDTTLLQQRADFLRPDSLLGVIALTDENDCSIREGGQYYYAAQLSNPDGTAFHLPRPRAECATNPNDACCLSCGQAKPAECPVDPSCGSPPIALTDIEDATSLRCWDQKRRFGIDFLYPVDRYVQALSSATIANRAGEMVPNPIFSDLNPNDQHASIRDQGHVFFTGIVGVPWQDIARDPNDLTQGFKNSDEMLADLGAGQTAWDVILGDPANYVPAADPHMIESIDPRAGTNPITGDAIQPPGSPSGADAINGHEWTPTQRDDLQYACIFPLPAGAERDCSIPGTPSCDCADPSVDVDVPLCEPNPNDNNQPTLQVRAKAYPGLRALQLIKDLRAQGIVGSVCPAQLVDPAAPDFGYRPTVAAFTERVTAVARFGDNCLVRQLPVDSDGRTKCAVIEATATGGACSCDVTARQRLAADHEILGEAILKDPLANAAGWDCLCEVVELQGEALQACQNETSEPVTLSDGAPVDGACYIDATLSPPIGNPELVSGCPDTSKRTIRLVGAGEATPGGTMFIGCMEME